MTTHITVNSADTMINDFKLMSLNREHSKNMHHDHHHQNYYLMDNCSDSTVTNTGKDNHLSMSKQRCHTNSIHNSNEFIEKFNSCYSNGNNNGPAYNYNQNLNIPNNATNHYNNNDNDHQVVLQSYLEPQSNTKHDCIDYSNKLDTAKIGKPNKMSRFSVIKSKVKKVFRLSNSPHGNQKRQSSLPVLPTVSVENQNIWNPSIDSMSSSATLVKPDQISTHSCSSQSSFTKEKPLFRHSCGLTVSPLFNRSNNRHSFSNSSQKQQQIRRNSILLHKKMKEKLNNNAIINSSRDKPIKGILKKAPLVPQMYHSSYPITPQQRPTSLNLEEKKKRWSNARLSIYEHQSNNSNKKRYTVLSMMSPTNKRNNQQVVENIRFNKYVRVHETYAKSDYDRSSDPEAVCNRLTPLIATQIKQELNYYKLHEMTVHDSSRIHTHFFL